jgi:hypothetical protein
MEVGLRLSWDSILGCELEQDISPILGLMPCFIWRPGKGFPGRSLQSQILIQGRTPPPRIR